ncbi:MAG: outer membrane protein assembly factor BamB, partial [Verrucomicrobiota bacterium]
MNRFSLLCLFLLARTAHCANWPEFLGPEKNNVSPETGLRQSIPENGLPIVWQKNVGTGYSAPSIWEKQLVLHHRK